MSDDESIARQRAKDAAYLRACKAAGIEPDLPKYISAHQAVEVEVIDRASNDDGCLHNGSTFRNRDKDVEPLRELSAEAEAAWKVLELLVPQRTDPQSFVATAGRRALVLAWLLGRRPEPLAELARSINITRASLSTFARRINDRLGLVGRGQKSASSRSVYADNARRSWKLRKLNRLMSESSAT